MLLVPSPCSNEVTYRHIFLSFYKSHQVVLYRCSGMDVAVGYLDPECHFIHGEAVPPGFKAVQLTWVQSSDFQLPLILGDPKENANLCVRQFFALPVADLSLAKLVWGIMIIQGQICI